MPVIVLVNLEPCSVAKLKEVCFSSGSSRKRVSVDGWEELGGDESRRFSAVVALSHFRIRYDMLESHPFYHEDTFTDLEALDEWKNL